MNERIRELAKHATEHYSNGQERSFDKEKFAQLIIEDCVNVVENLSPGYDDYRNQIEDAFRLDCIEEIKQHFGVAHEHGKTNLL